MIGVNSLHSAGRFRSRSLCSVRYGRDFRMMDPFRYPRTPRSRSLKPLAFPDLLGKSQDGQNHPQALKRKRVSVTHHSPDGVFYNVHLTEIYLFLDVYVFMYFVLLIMDLKLGHAELKLSPRKKYSEVIYRIEKKNVLPIMCFNYKLKNHS